MKEIVLGQPITDSSAQVYIERPSENAALASLKNGEWISFVAPPRTGKSSALIRWKKIADEKGIKVVMADCEKLAAYDDLSQAATKLINGLRQSLSLSKSPRLGQSGSSDSELVTAISQALRESVTEALRGGSSLDRLWIILDEYNVFTKPAGTSLTSVMVRLGKILVSAFSSLHSDATFHKRCTVCFAGCFEPEDCVGLADEQLDKFTKLAVLRDFSKEDVIPYAADLRIVGADSDNTVAAIFEHVGGMPLLFAEFARFSSPPESQASREISGLPGGDPIDRWRRTAEEAGNNQAYIQAAANWLMDSDVIRSATMFQLYWQCLIQFRTNSARNALPIDTLNRTHALALRNLGLIELDPGPVDQADTRWTATIRSPWVAKHFGETWVKRLLTVPGRLWLASCAEWFARDQNDQYLPHANVQEAWLNDGLERLPAERLTIAEQALKTKVLKTRSETQKWQFARQITWRVAVCVFAAVAGVYYRKAIEQEKQARQLQHQLGAIRGSVSPNAISTEAERLSREVRRIDEMTPRWSCIRADDRRSLTQLLRDMEEALPQFASNTQACTMERDQARTDASVQAAHTLDANGLLAVAQIAASAAQREASDCRAELEQRDREVLRLTSAIRDAGARSASSVLQSELESCRRDNRVLLDRCPRWANQPDSDVREASVLPHGDR